MVDGFTSPSRAGRFLIMLKNSVSTRGLLEAARNIFMLIGKGLFILACSSALAFSFWNIRACIPSLLDHTYSAYAIGLDSTLFGVVPSAWMQTHLRDEFLDTFLRGVWFSYSLVILFGANLVWILGADIRRYFLSMCLLVGTGLLIHYLLPTQPPWMAVQGVIRIDGEAYSAMDKNLTAAMPSIHQAVVCLLGCALWQYRIPGKLIALGYTIAMSFAIVYLGEHFFVDSLAGVLLAIVSWTTSKFILERWAILTNKKQG